MRRRHRKIKWVFVSAVFLAGVLVAAGAYVLFTRFGADLVTKRILPRYFPSARITYDSVSGNLARGVVYKNLLIRDWDQLPPASAIKIQFLGLRVSVWGEKGFRVEVENARLQLPGSEPIMVWGAYDHGWVDGSVYAHSVDLKEIHDILVRYNVPTSDFKGTLSDLDVRVKGPWSKVTLQGTFRLPQMVIENFLVRDAQGTFNLRGKMVALFLSDGRVDFLSRTVQGQKTAQVKLKPSRLLFQGDLSNPQFALSGTAVVADTRIEVYLKGTINQPDLQLASQPPLAQDQLLIMLATDRRWRGTQTAVEQGRVSADLAKDFIDYFVFAGLGSDLARKAGISDVSVKFDAQERGFDIQKDLPGSLSATYGIEQTTPEEWSVFTTQKIGGEFKLDDTTALGVEQRTKQPTLKSAESATTADKDEQILIKIKKTF